MSDTNTTKLFETLRQWRNDTAIKQGRKPYMVLNNDTLQLTAQALPRTEEALIDIKGWGEKKIKQYGEEILTLINHPDKARAETSTENILSVTEFLGLINKTMIQQVGSVKVQGEISEVGGRQGYAFFQLKDSSGMESLVECFVGWQKYELVKHLLEDGFEVVITGLPSIYPKNGRFRLLVENIEPIGEGALKKAFEALKKKLANKGYFDEERKRPIPEFIRKIGLITSETGAAINDFQKNLGKYGFYINFKDVFVEGDNAEQSIVSAIEWLNKNKPNLDILVLIRGGGSMENLKAFNSEKVADAIVLSRLPIITGIGHEKDETIAGHVSDKNFSTPTAAAVFIKIQRQELISKTESYFDEIIYLINEMFKNKKHELRYTSENLSRAFNRVLDKYRIIEQNFLKIVYKYETVLKNRLYNLDMLTRKAINILEKQHDLIRKRLEVANVALVSLNPESILKRGYSITYKNNGNLIKDSEQVEKGDKIVTRLYKGRIISKIDKLKH